MPIYTFDIRAHARNADVELDQNEATRFVKPSNQKLVVQSESNGAMTEFHYGDKAVSIVTLSEVVAHARVFIESTEKKEEITVYISGSSSDITVTTKGDTQQAVTTERRAY